MRKINLACLIEDDPVHVFLSKKYLDLTGRIENLMIFNNGKEAFDKLNAIFKSGEILPELILLDLNMPIWDGWQFLEEFTKIPVAHQVTIFILTSSIQQEDIDRAKEFSNVDNYIIKPITLENLQKLLDLFEKN